MGLGKIFFCRVNCKFIYFFAGLCSSIYASNSTDSLARVSVLNFSDQTNSKNYQYLSESLPDAIQKSMKEKFEFNSTDKKSIETAQKDLEKDLSQFDLSAFKLFAQKASCDIVIYGRYTYDSGVRQIAFQPVIYLAQSDKLITIPTRNNKVDSTIFQATEIIASDIVSEITRMANEARQSHGSNTESITEKSVLTRDLGYTVEKYSYTSLGLVVPINSKPTSPETPIAIGSDLTGLAKLNNMYTLRFQYKRLTISPYYQPYLVGELGYAGPFVSNITGNIFTFRIGASIPIKISDRFHLLPALEAGLSAGSTTYNYQNAPVNTYSSIRYTTGATILAGQLGFMYHIFSRIALEGGLRYDYRQIVSVPTATATPGSTLSTTTIIPSTIAVSDSQFGIYLMCSFLFRN